jgi:predicted RND superfamily exporter protein
VKARRWINHCFVRLAHGALARPKQTLVIVALITLAAVPGLSRLRLRTDGHALLPSTAPEVVYDQAIRRQFDVEDQIVVFIQSRHTNGIFNPATLQLVREVTTDLRKMPGINPSNVMSLATEPGFRFRPGTYQSQPLLEPALTNQPDIHQLRDDLRRIELYTGTLVSADGASTVILMGVPPNANRQELCQKVSRLIAARRSGSEELALTGAPVAEALLGIHILEDLGMPKSFLGLSARSSEAAWKFPVSLSELRLLLVRRLGLVPLAMLVMLAIFLFYFRNLPATLVPLPGLAATMLFAFGLMGWCGVPVYLTTAVMPVLLTATGVTNDIYLFNRYFTLLRQRPGEHHLELLRETFDRMAAPVASTSLATSIGFFSFAFSPLTPVRAFGVFTGIGVLFSLFYSLTAVPAFLALINPAALRPQLYVGTRNSSPALATWFASFGSWVVRWRWWLTGLAVVVLALTPLGLRRLVVQDSWIDGFEPDSEFRRVTSRLNEQFHGMHLLFIACERPESIAGRLAPAAVELGTLVLPANLAGVAPLIQGSSATLSIRAAGAETNATPAALWQARLGTAALIHEHFLATIVDGVPPTNFWTELSRAGEAHFDIPIHSHVRPEVIRDLGALGSFVRQRRQYAVGGVLSPADYLLTTRFMLRSSDPQARRMPEDPAEMNLLWEHYGTGRGEHRLRQVVDTNYWRSLTTVFLKDANFVDTAKLMNDIRAYERDHLTPQGIRLGFAGDVALSQALIRGIVTTQLQSLSWSVLGIFLVTAFLGGSLGWGLYCVLPSLLAVVIKFALMGWMGIPLGVATSMFAAMTLGIGINCALQLLEAYAQSCEDGEPNPLNRAMALTGPSALINTLAVSLGFGVLMLSQVPANARLGLLVVLGLLECFLLSLLLLPILLSKHGQMISHQNRVSLHHGLRCREQRE